jgi:hypothetical protein
VAVQEAEATVQIAESAPGYEESFATYGIYGIGTFAVRQIFVLLIQWPRGGR